ncbi:MAG: hypothetical protein Q7S12_03970 [bacterium]|nr:hypothetical protein [bacterium]
MNDIEKGGVFDEVTELGKKYELSTNRFMQTVSQKQSGTKVTRESIMQELIGEDYDAMPNGTKNLIFTTLIKPDLETAVDGGTLKQVSEQEYER